ncbi:hypothetical protein SAMN05444166_2396 [Singulisphaera sp. GP187]|nr:hypothetical protein SAMN05444166_2396 [Singulisphaera sp. GP187]
MLDPSTWIKLEDVRLADATRGFALLPRHWVIEHSVGRAAKFRRLASDYQRISETLAELHYVAFGFLVLHKAAPLLCGVHNTL